MTSQDKDMMYMRLEIDQLRKQRDDLRAIVKEFVGNFDRPELICPALLEAVEPERFEKLLKKSRKAA